MPENNFNKKIMFFDIDGTLMEDSSSHYMPESTVQALQLARQAGNLLFVNTGRPAVNVDQDVKNLHFDGYICGCGSSIEINQKEIFYHGNPPELCREIAQLVRDCNASPLYERRDAFFFDTQARILPFIREIRESFRIQEKNIWRSTEDPDFSFDKFVIAYDESTDLEKFKAGIASHFVFIDRGERFAEMAQKNYSKKTGIEYILNYYEIPKENAYAIGDSLNDLPMFEAVGTSIAMGNGEKLIPYADYVTADLWHDGIYQAMQKFKFF
ncbi:MAG: Cof-type HAD-IIB family hydrolase [Oscillospiraceae bacterium]|nr:Cof-type HAD-IIB family hydrolase [Oscillospiraceae bacterium]